MLIRMATLINVATLATFARTEIEPDDEFALLVLDEASGLVCDTAKHPEWEDSPSTSPRAARRICLQVAYRTFSNPDFEIAYGLGPLSGRSLDLYAMGLNLTEAETEELEDLWPTSSSGGLWVQPIDGDSTMYPSEVMAHDRWYPASDPIPFLGPEDAYAMTPEVS